MFNVSGTIKEVYQEQQVSDRFKKREFVLTVTTSQYPQYVIFQLTQDKCSLIDPFQPGEEIKVHFNLRGREWKDKEGKVRYFNSLEAWKLEKGASAGSASISNASQESVPETFSAKSAEDDLPF